MGYPSGSAYMSPVSATATTITPDLTQVTYASGDLLVIGLVHDDGGATNITESSAYGWTLIGGTAAQVSVADGARSALAYKFATSSAESNPTFTGAASQEWGYAIQVLKDIHQTGTIEGWQRTDFNNVASIASNAPTASSEAANAAIPVLANSTVLTFAFVDAASYFLRGKTDQQICLGKSSGSVMSLTMGHYQPDAAGTVPNFDTYISAADRSGSVWVVSFKNAASGTIAPYCRTGMDEFAWYGSWNSITPNPTWATLSTLVGGATINGISVSVAADGSADAPTVTNATANTFTPWGNSTNIASLENSASIWVGRSHAITSKNMSGKIFACQVEHDQASPYTRMGSEGVIVGFSDGTEWVIYQLFSKATIIARATPTSFQIALGNATVYDASDGTGAAMDWTAVTSMGWGYHRAGSSGTTQSISIKNACLLGGNTATAVGEGFSTLYGGSSAVPCTYSYLKPALESWGNYDLARNQADSQIDAFASVVVGGLNATYFDAAGYAFTFPSAKNTTSQTNWNGLANCVSLIPNGNATDTISMSGGLTASGLQQGFTIHASSDTGATYNFAGPIFRLLPVWKTGVECEDVSFSNCGKVALAGADATNLSILKTTATDAPLSISANGVVINGGTISATRDTGAATTYNAMLDAAVTALEMNGVTLSGTPSGDRIYSALTSGELTITLDGTGTSLVAGDVTFAAGTAFATIASPQPTLDAVVLANTRALLWNRTTSAELDNTLVAGTSWSKVIASGATSGDVLDLYTFKEGYAEARATIIYSGANATFAVEQAVDDAIDYYRTQESITDYTTLTEYDFYSPDIYIQADDADGESTLKNLFIFYNGVLTTADGATYMRGGVTFNSPFDVVINRSVRAIAVDNVSVTHGLHFTDEDVIRVTTDDGTSWIAPPSAPGSIRYAFGVSPGQIETTGSSVITGTAQSIIDAIPSAAANADAVAAAATANPFASNVKQVNDTPIIGTGVPPTYANMPVPTDPGDPFRVA